MKWTVLSVNLAVLATYSGDSFIGHIVGESYSVCKKECSLMPECKMLKYYRHFGLCKLYRSENGALSSVRELGETLYLKSKDDVGYTCEDVCSSVVARVFCPPPKSLPYALVFGNMREIGARVKYTCLDESGESFVTCLENGTWSNNDIKCSCQINAQNSEVTLSRVDANTLIAHITCHTGYAIYGDTFDVSCDILTGTWTDEQHVHVCQNEFEDVWQYVFSYSKFSTNHILDYYKGIILTTGAFADFRNNTVLDNWTELNITKIKVELIDEGIAVRYLVFDGNGTNSSTWYAMDHIIESSLFDLNKDTDTGGLSYYHSESDALFFAYKLFPQDGNCYDDRVWVAVADLRCIYPCPYIPPAITGDSIMYSRYINASQFVREKVAFADRLNIWVEQGV